MTIRATLAIPLLVAAASAGCAGGATGGVEYGYAERHPEKKFLITHDGDQYRVTARYVSAMGASAIAVRQMDPAVSETPGQPVERIALERVDGTVGSEFPNPVNRMLAAAVAEAVRGRVCPNGQEFRVSGEPGAPAAPRAEPMFYSARAAWVTFGGCVAPTKEASQ